MKHLVASVRNRLLNEMGFGGEKFIPKGPREECISICVFPIETNINDFWIY